MKRPVAIASACAVAIFGSGVLWSMQSVRAQDKTVEEELHIHRLKAGTTSPYDAFTYLNRVADKPTTGETPVEYAGNVIFSRLANTEGRIQLKVVKGFQRPEYLGYKSFMRAWEETEGTAVGNCVVCHTPSTFGGTDAKPAPPLRNLKKSNEELKKIVLQKVAMAEKARGGDTKIDEAYKLVRLSEQDVDNMVAFLQSLNELPHDEFRQIVVDATILDTSDMGFN
jgi:hypothetical protein